MLKPECCNDLSVSHFVFQKPFFVNFVALSLLLCLAYNSLILFFFFLFCLLQTLSSQKWSTSSLYPFSLALRIKSSGNNQHLLYIDGLYFYFWSSRSTLNFGHVEVDRGTILMVLLWDPLSISRPMCRWHILSGRERYELENKQYELENKQFCLKS